VLERSTQITREALSHVDLLVVLPLNSIDAIEVGADEHPEVRQAMNNVLLDLIDDTYLIGDANVVEITGDRDHRLSALEALTVRAAD
jgi:hypothetical protein